MLTVREQEISQEPMIVRKAMLLLEKLKERSVEKNHAMDVLSDIFNGDQELYAFPFLKETLEAVLRAVADDRDPSDLEEDLKEAIASPKERPIKAMTETGERSRILQLMTHPSIVQPHDRFTSMNPPLMPMAHAEMMPMPEVPPPSHPHVLVSAPSKLKNVRPPTFATPVTPVQRIRTMNTEGKSMLEKYLEEARKKDDQSDMGESIPHVPAEEADDEDDDKVQPLGSYLRSLLEIQYRQRGLEPGLPPDALEAFAKLDRKFEKSREKEKKLPKEVRLELLEPVLRHIKDTVSADMRIQYYKTVTGFGGLPKKDTRKFLGLTKDDVD